MVKAQLNRLVLITVLLHLAVAVGIFLVGRASVLPGVVDSRGIASFASDSRVYQMQTTALEQTLKQDGVRAWLHTPTPVHVKLYSLSYAIFSPLVGQNILGAEPLNLLFYLSTLLLIFAIGREVFGAPQGLLAAWMCLALLPSFLLHTTQLLKDPLFIVATLLLIWITVRWLTIEHKLTSGLIVGAVGGGAAASLWLIKNSAWWVVIAVILVGAILSLALQAHRRTVMTGNLAGIALVISIAIAASYLLTPYYLPREYWAPYNPASKNEGSSGEASTLEPRPQFQRGNGRRVSSRKPAAITDIFFTCRRPNSENSGRLHRTVSGSEFKPGHGSKVDQCIRYLPLSSARSSGGTLCALPGHVVPRRRERGNVRKNCERGRDLRYVLRFPSGNPEYLPQSSESAGLSDRVNCLNRCDRIGTGRSERRRALPATLFVLDVNRGRWRRCGIPPVTRATGQPA